MSAGAVPEPGTWAMFAAGFGVTAFMGLKRRAARIVSRRSNCAGAGRAGPTRPFFR